MVEPLIIITNNPMVMNKMSNKLESVFIDGTLMDVLKHVRDYVHKGHSLLTHPLSGSIKPNVTPYKTVLISYINGKTIDIESLSIIESSIHTAEKLMQLKEIPKWSEKILDDFSLIDYDLIYHAIN